MSTVKITNKFEQESCSNKVKYSLIHKKIPLEISPELMRSIEYLLWYVPDISSIQSRDNEMVSNYLYDDFTFENIAEFMNLNDEDVLFTDEISKGLENFYKYEICPHKQKIIMTKSSSETKTSATLRHIRNAIAHGSFTIVGDLLVGFDYRNTFGEDDDECTAIFKIDPKNLLKALENLDSQLTSEALVKRALETCDYTVKNWQNKKDKKHSFDLFAEKGENKFAIEIKKYKSDVYSEGDYITQKQVEELVDKFKGIFKNINMLLVINTSLLSDDSKDYLLNPSVIIMDPKNIKKLLAGRDILGEIIRDRKY